MADDGEREHLDRAERELHDAIAGVLNGHGLVVTKWTLAAEVMDGAGERALESFTSPDFREWDSIGIVGYLDARERGVVAAVAARDIFGEDGG